MTNIHLVMLIKFVTMILEKIKTMYISFKTPSKTNQIAKHAERYGKPGKTIYMKIPLSISISIKDLGLTR